MKVDVSKLLEASLALLTTTSEAVESRGPRGGESSEIIDLKEEVWSDMEPAQGGALGRAEPADEGGVGCSIWSRRVVREGFFKIAVEALNRSNADEEP